MTYFKVCIGAAQPALGDQHRHFGGDLPEAARRRLDQHVREARLERQAGDGAAVRGDLPTIVNGAQPRQPVARFGERGGGRRIEEGQARRVGFAPQQTGQQQARQVGLEDLGRVVRGERGGRGLFPQADGDTRPLPRGAPRALRDRGAAGAFGH